MLRPEAYQDSLRVPQDCQDLTPSPTIACAAQDLPMHHLHSIFSATHKAVIRVKRLCPTQCGNWTAPVYDDHASEANWTATHERSQHPTQLRNSRQPCFSTKTTLGRNYAGQQRYTMHQKHTLIHWMGCRDNSYGKFTFLKKRLSCNTTLHRCSSGEISVS